MARFEQDLSRAIDNHESDLNAVVNLGEAKQVRERRQKF